MLTRLWAGHSPDQVAGRLGYEYPEQKAHWVSHEAIYTWIYALPTGELARQGIVLRSEARSDEHATALAHREPGLWA